MKETNILLVEDEAMSVMFLKMILKRAGYTLINVVATGEDAVKVALEVNPDLILMDISLAGAIDGIQAAKEIKGKLNVPIIFMTGYPDKAHMERAKEVNPYKYFVKPIETSDLLEAINSV